MPERRVSGVEKRRRRNPAATRRALMAAGAELFARRGFDGAKTDQIARSAHVNKAMINYHFGGKKGLYQTILVDAFSAASERLGRMMSAGGPADERLRVLVQTYGELMRQRPSIPTMMVREIISGGRFLDDRVLPYILSLMGAIREILEQGRREGVFRPVDPLLTHISLMGGIVLFFASIPFRERLLRERRLRPRPPSVDEYIDLAQNLLIHGVSLPASTLRRRSS